jgi:TIR domain
MTTGDDSVDAGNRPGPRWDVALSFASAQRDYVKQVAEALQARGIRCFYDADNEIDLWGKHLAEVLPAIYGEQAAVVVVFISAEYAARDWTRLERRTALGRAISERREYVLPARFDDTPLPGLLADMVKVDLHDLTPAQFAGMVAEKLAALGIGPSASAATTDPSGTEAMRPLSTSAGGKAGPPRLGMHAAISAPGVPGEVSPVNMAWEADAANISGRAYLRPALPTAREPSAQVMQPGSSRPKSTTDLEGLNDQQIRVLHDSTIALHHLIVCLEELNQTLRPSADFAEESARTQSSVDRAKARVRVLAQHVTVRDWPHEEWILHFCDAERNFNRNAGVGGEPYSDKFALSAIKLQRVIADQYPSLFIC